jgi:oligosaccharide repeat unit polymerase
MTCIHSITLNPRSIYCAKTAAAAGSVDRRKTLLCLHIALASMLAAAGMLYPALSIDAEKLLYPICVAVALVFLWILWTWFALRRTLFEPYPLFVVSAGLFNAGQAFLELFGMNPNGMLGGRVAPEILVRGLYLVILSMALLHTGALLALGARRPRESPENRPARCRAMRMVGWFLLAVATVPTFTLFQNSFSLVLDYGYLGLFRYQNTLSRALALSAFLVPGSIFLLAGAVQKRGLQLFCLLLTAAYGAMYLFLGARGSAAMVCIAAVWVFDRSIRPVPRLLIVALALVALVLFPLVRETRNTGGRYRLSLDEQLQTLGNLESPISSSVSEMGYSLVTVTHTVSLVPVARPFDYGLSYLYALTAILPNIGWEVHPSISHGLLSDWLVRTVDPVVAAAGGGLGFSFIAEAYMNFGWFGGPIWIGLIGYALCRLFLRADVTDPAKQAFTASFLAFFFVFARGESAIIARGLVWYSVIPYLLVSILTARVSRGKRRI